MDNTKEYVTEEEIQEARIHLDGECCTVPINLIERMWSEIQVLRDTIKKQIY